MPRVGTEGKVGSQRGLLDHEHGIAAPAAEPLRQAVVREMAGVVRGDREPAGAGLDQSGVGGDGHVVVPLVPTLLRPDAEASG